MIVAALALIGVFVALYLTMYKMGAIAHLACGLGGCERVNTSQWSIFFGAPVAAWGLAFYVATFIVALVGTSARYADGPEISNILAVMSFVGVVFSAWLTYLELYVIGAICKYCVSSAVIVTLIFIVSIADMMAHSRVAKRA
ncbi:MAG: vitamin K epoxide reductase family protein [Gemmatimonadales bacterium]|jgi:uncharacterized membrane protein